MDKLYVIKIGGNVVDDEAALSAFLNSLASVREKKILVHGGGKIATNLAEKLSVPQQMVEGRRITDAETLKIVTMVYAGLINKNIVALLQASGCDAVGLTGADGNTVRAHKRNTGNADYGFAGDVDEVDLNFFSKLLEGGYTPVVAPLTHDRKGQLLNTNADTMAQEIAKALSKTYEVSLIYSFEKDGVMMNVNDPASVILKLDQRTYQSLKHEGKIFAGMIPKLDNAFGALESGVRKVIIGKAEQLHYLVNGTKGTTIIHE